MLGLSSAERQLSQDMQANTYLASASSGVYVTGASFATVSFDAVTVFFVLVLG